MRGNAGGKGWGACRGKGERDGGQAGGKGWGTCRGKRMRGMQGHQLLKYLDIVYSAAASAADVLDNEIGLRS